MNIYDIIINRYLFIVIFLFKYNVIDSFRLPAVSYSEAV